MREGICLFEIYRPLLQRDEKNRRGKGVIEDRINGEERRVKQKSVWGQKKEYREKKEEVWRIERNEPGAVADDIFVQDTVRQHPQAGVH